MGIITYEIGKQPGDGSTASCLCCPYLSRITLNMPVSRFRQRFLCLLASLLVTCPAWAAPKDTAADSALEDVRRHIAAHDCDTAVSRLKAWLKQGEPKVFLLAATMYDNGLCVKRDWSKAVDFYVIAFEKGLPEAAERLAAGYADPANGPDIAAALWWARKGRSFRLPACAASKNVADDPEGFVTELGLWPQDRLTRCNYMVGVLSTISAELNYPKSAAEYHVGGDVTLRFLPGQARIEVKQGESREYALLGWVDGDAFRDRWRPDVTGAFEKALSGVAKRALARYPQPPGIPVDMKVEVTYSFTVTFD